MGSVAGCGRYDNTIGRFVGKRMPATGGSFGIDRIVEIVKDRKMFRSTKTPIKVLVTLFDQNLLQDTLMVTNELRKNNIPIMLYPEPVKLDKQLKYADRKKIPYVVILGPNEISSGSVILKDMRTSTQTTVSQAELILKIKE